MTAILVALQALLLTRFVLVLSCALRARTWTWRGEAIALPFVSIVIPALDEADSIERTLRSVAASELTEFEIIVVDDGSSDETPGVLRGLEGELPRLVTLRFPKNQGKAAALNAGISRARGAVVITIDADTTVTPQTVPLLARAVLEDGVGAAAAHVRVGNASNLLTRWQALEYVGVHFLERRAQATWGCITTVPGAAAGWRKEALQAAGGFSARTCTEDMDLTLTLHEQGWRVVFAAQALAFTSAPVTWRALFRQRLRWLYGNLQAAAFHLSSLFRPRRAALGFLGLPNVWFTQLGVYLLLPFSILATLTLTSVLGWWTLGVFGALWALDLLACRVAFALEGSRPPALGLLVAQRLAFPFFLLAVFVVAMARRAAGRPVGWAQLKS